MEEKMPDQTIGGGLPLNSKTPFGSRGKNSFSREMLREMKETLSAEVLEKPLPESLTIAECRGDEVDQAGEERSRELYLLLTTRNMRKLQALEEAWEKADKGTYGICEECNDPIGAGRLKAVPLATLCITCQSKLEKEQKPLLLPEQDLFPDEEAGALQ
jgi:DnaK suppressor protein